MKHAIKQWWKQSFDTPSVRIRHIRENLKALHTKLGTDPMNTDFQDLLA